MVESEVPGIWKKKRGGGRFEKEDTNVKIILEKDEVGIHCVLEYRGSVKEYRRETEYPDELAKRVMNRESHGGNIRDIVEEEDFQEISC